MPRRACLAGGCGIGRRTWRASSSGSRARATRADTDRRAGRTTSTGPSPRARCSLPLGEQQARVQLPGRDQLPLLLGEPLLVIGELLTRHHRRRASPDWVSPAGGPPRPGLPPLRPPRSAGRPGWPASPPRPPRRAAGCPRRRPAGRPARHRPRAGLARGAHLGEERRRAERRGRLPPPVAGAAEPERGPGRRDVREPPLLRQVAARARLVELREGVSVERGQLGQVVLVAAQRERDQPGITGPPSSASAAWPGRPATSPPRPVPG